MELCSLAVVLGKEELIDISILYIYIYYIINIIIYVIYTYNI